MKTQEKRNSIPYFQEINDFLATTPFPNRTNNPDFYCLRVRKGNDVKQFYKPPFRRSFYFMALLNNLQPAQITYDNLNKVNLTSTLVFQAPGLLSSFRKTNEGYGYLIYFKPECFSFFKPDFAKAFPFFDLNQTHFLELTPGKFDELTPFFEEVFLNYENNDNHQIASLKLLTILCQLKDFVTGDDWKNKTVNHEAALLKRFSQLVNDHFIEKKTVEEYAELLSVTAKHLSRVVKESSGKKALIHINERILAEAKSLILYTELDISEICYQLNFSDPANFSKFFKRHTGLTPLQFRKQNAR